MRVLVVEDDKRLAKNIEVVLKEAGMTIDVVHSGFDAQEMAMSDAYDVIVLDWMLPDIEGPSVARTLRRQKVATPILLLTSLGQVEQKVEGLDSGADDYLTKPFEREELVARLRTLTRRHTTNEATRLNYGPIELNLASRELKIDGERVDASARELSLIEFFLRRPERLHSRLTIFENVWDVNLEEGSNVLDVYIGRVRKRLGDYREYIETVPGSGYRFQKPPE